MASTIRHIRHDPLQGAWQAIVPGAYSPQEHWRIAALRQEIYNMFLLLQKKEKSDKILYGRTHRPARPTVELIAKRYDLPA
jgi:hypothetical protein